MNMNANRERYRSDIHKHLATLLRRDVSDPRLQGVSITRIDLGNGNDAIHVWVHSMLESDSEMVVDGLQRLSGFLRHALGRSLRRRRIPALRFHWDMAFEQGNEMVELLNRMSSQ
ncbi:MAG: 30S ribosome-binding factor RbfA [Mariprofundales bacterium]|nr:30S ribosome-binding factor RbfA [Mariprofundales bacterium]